MRCYAHKFILQLVQTVKLTVFALKFPGEVQQFVVVIHQLFFHEHQLVTVVISQSDNVTLVISVKTEYEGFRHF